MIKAKAISLAAVIAVLTLAGGIGLSSTSAGASSSEPTYTLGLLTDLTGPLSNGTTYSPDGVKAGLGLENHEGYKLKFVVADTTSSPAGALSAAQKLVEQDHVFAVLAVSGLTFAAAPYLTSQGVPVIGAAEDGSEWITARNMFSIYGTQDFSKVESTFGKFFKLVGGTRIATLGLGISPSSSEAAKGAALSAEAAGLKAPYVNANFPYGSNNVAPEALAMKSDDVNGLVTATETNTTFALIAALKNEGVHLTAALAATGYGADLEQGGADAQQIAQGVYFLDSYEPAEMKTPATEQLHNALEKYAGWKGDPGLNMYLGYASVLGFVDGLKAAGSHPTQASYIDAMLKLTDVNPGGLFGTHSVSFALDQRGKVAGADNCFFATRYQGTTFHLVPGADPICGTNLPETVSAG